MSTPGKKAKPQPSAAYPQQDRDAGLTNGLQVSPGGRRMTSYSEDLALQICELIAEGHTLLDICELEGMPARATFNRWVLIYPQLAAVYRAAREASAYSMEDEAIRAARHIKMLPGDSVKVRSYEVFLNHLRWNMARRNPAIFSDKVAANITVPIQINTTLDLGQEGGGAPVVESRSEVYMLKAEVPGEQNGSVDKEAVPGRGREDRDVPAGGRAGKRPQRLLTVPPVPREPQPPKRTEPDPALKPKRKRGVYGD